MSSAVLAGSTGLVVRTFPSYSILKEQPSCSPYSLLPSLFLDIHQR